MPIKVHHPRVYDSKRGKARRALTIYFATVQEKQTFDKLAQGFGMSSSTLGTIVLHAGMREGFRVMSGDSQMVVHSEGSGPPITGPEQPKRTRLSDLVRRLLGRSS